MAGGQASRCHQSGYLLRQMEQAQGIGDRRTGFAHRFCGLLLR